MKRILILLLAAILLTCVCSAAEPDPLDVNGDGKISVVDALLVIRSILNGTADTCPDLNGDGRCTLIEVLWILRTCRNAPFDALVGLGTADNPYQIASATDLKLVSKQVLAYVDTEEIYFKQTADIELSATENWVPIGTSGIPFAGQYDGGGYSIKNLYISTDESFQGLFGFITGTVKNLHVYGTVSVHYTGTHSHSFAGGIVGAMNNGALVQNCNSYVTIEGDSYVGGVVGAVLYTDDYLTDAFSTIDNCNFYGTLTADDRSAINEDAMYFGGIAGRSYGAVKNCTNYGDILVSGEKTSYIGGISGYAYSPYKTYSPSAEQLPLLAMENCENKGTVSGGEYVAGIVAQTSLSVKNCVNNGAISGAQYVGGIAGVNGTSATYTEGISVISNCTNNATITVTKSNGGGIAGYNFVCIESCSNAGTVAGTEAATRIGGIAGYSRGNILACDNLASAPITGYQSLGGIVGYFYQANASVSDCHNYADVSTANNDADAYHIGGIVGMLGSTNSILRCTNTGDILGGGDTHGAGTGGIVGSLHSTSIIDTCINRGNVHATVRLGGIAGYGKMNKSSYIRNCENYGTVSTARASGDVYLGGILGLATSGNVVDCTNYGDIQAAGTVGCFEQTVGSASSATVVTNVK